MSLHFTFRVSGGALEVTSWLPGRARPAHAGVYQRSFPAGPYSCWDGRSWIGDAATPGDAAAHRARSRHQQASWRGLAGPAPGRCPTCGGHGIFEREDEESGEARFAECPDC